MTLAEHKSVPVRVVRPVRIDVEDSPVQIDKQVHAGKAGSEMWNARTVRSLKNPAT